MSEIILQKENILFSYRVGGICMQNGKVLLQRQAGEEGFTIPGGHVEFGETSEDCLRREFREELDTEIAIGPLRWVAENFFNWKGKSCQQLCLYYPVTLIGTAKIPLDGSFIAREQLSGESFDMAFHWIPLDQLSGLDIYPSQAAALLLEGEAGVKHFVYRERETSSK